ncbi:hypothetical protein D3C85_1215400 [compost metagenome]
MGGQRLLGLLENPQLHVHGFLAGAGEDVLHGLALRHDLHEQLGFQFLRVARGGAVELFQGLARVDQLVVELFGQALDRAIDRVVQLLDGEQGLVQLLVGHLGHFRELFFQVLQTHFTLAGGDLGVALDQPGHGFGGLSQVVAEHAADGHAQVIGGTAGIDQRFRSRTHPFTDFRRFDVPRLGRGLVLLKLVLLSVDQLPLGVGLRGGFVFGLFFGTAEAADGVAVGELGKLAR